MMKEKKNQGSREEGITRRDFVKLGVAGTAAILAGNVVSGLQAEEKGGAGEKEAPKAKESGRLVCHKNKFPTQIKEGKFPLWICACGLSKKQPYCDGSHKRTEGEQTGGLYVYSDKERIDLNP